MSDMWDVIVVGAGSAGLPAAIRAAERGARVLQVEADEKIGGTLHLSSGQISAAGTKRQKRLGIEDSAQAHYEDAQRIAEGTIDPTLGKLATANAGATYDWLEELGYEPIAHMPVAGGAHEPYLTKRYYWAENMAVAIHDVLKPVHDKLVADGKIDLRLKTRMTGIVTNADGAAIGITVDSGGKTETLHGQNIVVTTGGYAHNADLWKEMTPDIPLRAYTNDYSRGDGLLAARKIGAKVDGADTFLCTFAGVLDDPKDPYSTALGMQFAPQMREPWEIYVNTDGKRFVREDHPSVDEREHALLAQKDQRMFVVFDEGIRQNAPHINPLDPDLHDKFGNHPHYTKADTLAELAQQMGVDAGNLEATVSAYNAAVDSGEDKELGRIRMFRKIEQAPFYAIHAGGITVVSPAGLNVTSDLQVTKEDGTPIPNLYAAGEVLGFGRLSGKAFVNGMSLMPALSFGRLLGEKILKWEGARAAAE
jgi:fumarate reductase flavoprotein subunit